MNPLTELRTKNVALTPAAEDAIRARAARLGRFCSRIERCTVTVEGAGRHHRQGNYRVRIDLVLPGAELIVEKDAQANLEQALGAAFQAVGRRLEEQVQISRGFVKHHERD